MNAKENKKLISLFNETKKAVLRATRYHNALVDKNNLPETDKLIIGYDKDMDQIDFDDVNIEDIDDEHVTVEWCEFLPYNDYEEGSTFFPHSWLVDETYEEEINEAIKEKIKKHNLKKLKSKGKIAPI